MIDEIDAAIKALLKEEALDGSEVDVVFDAPTKDWAARRNAPTVNAYLYDIREDVRKRTRGMINEYDDSGVVVGRRLPPRFYNLSYLVTAWTQRPEDEHRLLAQMLFCFSSYEAMPQRRLTGHIGALRLPVEMRISLPPPEDRSFADVWTALGGELKPSIDVVLSVPLSPPRVLTAGPPVTQPPRVAVLGASARPPERRRRQAGIELGTTYPHSEQSATAREPRWADAVRETVHSEGGRIEHDGPSSLPADGAGPAESGRPDRPSPRDAWLALAGQAARDQQAETSEGPPAPDQPAPNAGSRGRRRRLRVDLGDGAGGRSGSDQDGSG